MSNINSGFTLTGPTVAKLAAMYRDSKRDNNDLSAPDRTPVSDGKYFWGTVQTTGPAGTEDDYTDARYWVQRQIPSNSGGQATDSVSFAAMAGDYAQTITATNSAELLIGSHNLKPGAVVQVWWEYDFTSPTPNVRYIIGSGATACITGRIDHAGQGDGLYTGVIFSGIPNITISGDAADLVYAGNSSMQAGTVQCIFISDAEIPEALGDGPQHAAGHRLSIGSFVRGHYLGPSADAIPVPVIIITGVIGRINNPKDLNATGTAGSGGVSTWTGNSTTWDWPTDASPLKIHPLTSVIYDGSSNASGGLNPDGSSMVTQHGSHMLVFPTRPITFDALGHIFHVDTEPSSVGNVAYIQLKQVSVISDLQVSGTAVQYQTQSVWVFDYDAPSGWTTLDAGTTCP